MKKRNYCMAFVIILILPFFNFSQSNYSVQNHNRAINAHFLGEQLSGIAEYEPLRYQAILDYFKSSFTVSKLDCPSCEIDYDVFYNVDLFDVSKFEEFRLQSAEYSMIYKNTYSVKLKPIDLMPHNFSLAALLDRKVNRPFPSWLLTNSSEDYAEYHQKVKDWQNDFPAEFKTMYYSEGFYKISFAEFSTMTLQKQQAILNNSEGYLLMD